MQPTQPVVTVTYYLEVISSWCFWAEPMWAELKHRYASRPVAFGWKIALMDQTGLPKSRAQCDWFYRRSGTIMRSPFMLNSGWFEANRKQYLAPNLVAEAARDFGVTDDRVRLAIAHAALRDGRKVGRWDQAVAIGAQAADLDPAALLAKAKSEGVEARARATTAEFHGFQINQRPAFVLADTIGDRAIFSGLVTSAPLTATLDAMLHDCAAYASHAAHLGALPPG
jgi:predicted DsbA family dithiol-disulfide isomerase